MIITIDGPSGTGKSTIAKLLAKRLQFSFFDTGAMYRAFAWWIQKEKLDWRNKDIWSTRLKDFQFSIEETLEEKRYFVGSFDVSEEIRSKQITEIVSQISAIKEIREFLLPVQRQFAETHNCIFEGRDLGTVVFPKADVKIFLTASSEVRGKRRYLELLAKKPDACLNLEEVTASLERRDHEDSSREIAPLKCPDDAYLLDTSNLSIDQVIDNLSNYILLRKNNARLVK